VVRNWLLGFVPARGSSKSLWTAYPNRNMAGMTIRSDRYGSNPYRVKSQYVPYIATIIDAPCAKLITSRTP
jgi:hypothetical protein